MAKTIKNWSSDFDDMDATDRAELAAELLNSCPDETETFDAFIETLEDALRNGLINRFETYFDDDDDEEEE